MKTTHRALIYLGILLLLGGGLTLINTVFPTMEEDLREHNSLIIEENLSLGVNDTDSLIADETYVCTDQPGLGYTFNIEIADILYKRDSTKVVYIDSADQGLVYYWFAYVGDIPVI